MMNFRKVRPRGKMGRKEAEEVEARVDGASEGAGWIGGSGWREDGCVGSGSGMVVIEAHLQHYRTGSGGTRHVRGVRNVRV